MSEWLKSPEFFAGVFVVLVPILAGLLIWTLRERLGLFRRIVRWAPLADFSGSFRGKLSESGDDIDLSWDYYLLTVPRGSGPVRNLQIHTSLNIVAWNLDPKVLEVTIAKSERADRLSIGQIEGGNYLLKIVSSKTFLGEVTGLAAENAKVERGFVEAAKLIPGWRYVLSIIWSGLVLLAIGLLVWSGTNRLLNDLFPL